MEFQNPLNWIWCVPGAILWTVSIWKIFKKPQIMMVGKFISTSGILLRSIVFFIGLAGWVYLAYALMGPRLPLGFSESKRKVNDIFFVIDVSASMRAVGGFKPNRLEAAKRKILEFVELRPKDRIGIVMFGEKAFTLLPLTTDLELIKQMVLAIQSGRLGAGTNIGDALGLGVARSTLSLADNKVIILLTDGVSNVGNITPIEAANQAKEQGVKVYSIGIGGADNERIPGMRNIPGGSIDYETLQEISKVTGAKSYLAADQSALSEVFDEIDKLERTEIEIGGQMIYEEMYFKFLLYALALLIMSEISRRFVLKEGL